jgi:hypothetical protein
MKATKAKRKATRAKPGDPAKRGTKCPKCEQPTRVVYSNHAPDGSFTRRRKCSCGHTFTTDEVAREKRNSVNGIPDSVNGMTLGEFIAIAKRSHVRAVPIITGSPKQ